MHHKPHRQRKRLKQPVVLGDLVGQTAPGWKARALHRLEIIRSKWALVAGEYVARNVVPVRLVRTTLRVAAFEPGWASEMTYLVGPILERLQQEIPAGWVEEIRMVAIERLAPEERPTPPPQISLLPETAAMRAVADDLGRDIQDPEVAEALRRARVASLRREPARRKSD